VISNYFYEEKTLFPTALEAIAENEWKEIRHQFDETGYYGFTPEAAKLQ